MKTIALWALALGLIILGFIGTFIGLMLGTLAKLAIATAMLGVFAFSYLV